MFQTLFFRCADI